MEGPSEQLDLNDQMTRRREELEALKNMGIDHYPHAFERTAFSKDILESFKDDAPRQTVC